MVTMTLDFRSNTTFELIYLCVSEMEKNPGLVFLFGFTFDFLMWISYWNWKIISVIAEETVAVSSQSHCSQACFQVVS